MYFMPAVAFIGGLLLGSFANVCIWRIPRESSVVTPSSFCPKCLTPIKWYHNVPVLSYIFLNGKCASCARPISLRYPLIEMVTGLLTAGWFIRFETVSTALVFTLFGLGLIIISGVDMDYRVIPPQVSYPLMVAGLGLAFFNGFISEGPRIIYAAAGLVTGGLTVFVLRVVGKAAFKKEAIGLGDMKLMMAIGAFTGPAGIFWTLFIGSFLGSLVGIGMQISGEVKRGTYIPFGPFLAAGAALYVLFSEFFKSLFLI